MRFPSILRFIVPAVLAACAPTLELVPGPAAELAPGTRSAAVASAAGVQVVARPNQWPGPVPIGQRVTPMRVTIENTGSVPVLIRYSEFALSGAAGKTYAAVPPFDIRGTVSQPVLGPGYAPLWGYPFAARGFVVSPLYGPMYPAFPVMDATFPYHPFYYDTYRHYWVDHPLPTPDMVQFALPEGRLDPGGKIDGFLYFQKLDAEAAGSVEFTMRLVDAQGKKDLGTVRIPFQLRVG